MGQKVFGLDLGSYSIKGAIFDVSFGTFTLTDLFESSFLKADDLTVEQKIEATREALKGLVDENRINPHVTVSAIPGNAISTRMLTLPFNKKKVEKVLPFELENYLPFTIDQLIIDYHTIRTSRNSTTLLASAVKKNLMANHLKVFEGVNIDPKFVDIDSFSLLNVYHILEVAPSETVALIDLGHSKTNIAIISNGELLSLRTLLTGGKNLTNALRMKLDLTYDQAEEVKIRHGILKTEETPALKKDLKKITEVLTEAIDPLIEEIKQTIQAFKSKQSASEDESEKKKVDQLFLCGGTSLMRNIDTYFLHKTRIKTSLLHCFPPTHEISKKLGPRERVMTQSIALGVKIAVKNQNKKVSDINLRKDAFSFQHEFKGIKSKASFIVTWLAILAFFVIANFGVRYYKLSLYEADQEKKMLYAMKSVLGDDYKKLKITSASKGKRIIEERIKKAKDQIEILTAGLAEVSALSILQEISARTPKDITVDVVELNIFRNNITFNGEIDSFSSVDKLIASLRQFEPFTDVQKGEISDAAEPGKKKFSINITVGEKRN